MARELRAKWEAKELGNSAKETGNWDWVPAWLDRHCKTELTLERYTTAWKWLASWLQTEHINSPRQISYKKGIKLSQLARHKKKKTGKKAGRNTAVFELKILATAMDEAVRLEESDANPLKSLDVERDPAKEKPEIKEEEIRKILKALEREPEWMRLAFTIALAAGCRLRESRLHVDNIKANKISFGKPKGGRKKAFSIPMHSHPIGFLKKVLEQFV